MTIFNQKKNLYFETKEGQLEIKKFQAGIIPPLYQQVDWISITLVVALLVVCLQPFFNCCYRTARYQTGYTIIQGLMSPFGLVRFRDFYFYDILSSFGPPLVDIGYTFTYFFRGNFKEKNPYGINETMFMQIWAPILAYAPYWWRMWQCWNMWWLRNNKVQLFNGFKYLSKLLPLLAWYLGSSKKIDEGKSFWGFVLAQVIGTCYCIYWDYRWDWGMFIGTKPSTKYLRDQTKFSPNFYYFCMAQNFFFRWWWIVDLFTFKFYGDKLWYDTLYLMAFIT